MWYHYIIINDVLKLYRRKDSFLATKPLIQTFEKISFGIGVRS